MPNLTKLIFIALWSIVVTVPTLPANAHHSYAHFDQKIYKTLVGTVKKWEFTYPHTWLWATTKGPDDADVLFGFEGSAPTSLALYGWTPELLFKGDEIAMDYNPLRDGRNGGSIRSVVLPTAKRIQGQGSNSDLFFAECKVSDSDYVGDQGFRASDAEDESGAVK